MKPYVPGVFAAKEERLSHVVMRAFCARGFSDRISPVIAYAGQGGIGPGSYSKGHAGSRGDDGRKLPAAQ